MLSSHLLIVVAAVLCVSAQNSYVLSPVDQANQDSANSTGTTNGQSDMTDMDAIVQMAAMVDQRGGADGTPGSSAAPTMLVTTVDGETVLINIPDANSTETQLGAGSGYRLVFNGTVPDAAINGTAYLTWNNVSTTSECLAYCDATGGCEFVNMYTQLSNDGQQESRCVLFADLHTAAEKTNNGADGMSIQDSVGYAAVELMEPAVPKGYELVFGPISAANNAPGYMGFELLSKYDPSACAVRCNQRGPDAAGGACKYFNIWRAVEEGKPTTYTCSMYYIPADQSTATNTGQGSLAVTQSRGYKRTTQVTDGDFEAYACSDGSIFCFAQQAPGWVGTSAPNGSYDATIFHYAPYAHGGNGVGLLGSAFGRDPQPGTLTATVGNLVHKGVYSVQFFLSSTYSGQQLEKPAFVEVWWNGAVVGSVHVGYSPWKYYEFTVTAMGGGADTLQFHGGMAPAYSFLDDVYLFAL
ncbi:hypothetical protein DFH06DRAFT_514629 [Mycena polygramma]|nr:hypothetical protein DFH06DRAFT_514629 [Mycena polygramma]